MKLIQLAVSLGGVQSLIEVASGMTHCDKYLSAAERLDGGLKESLIRFRCAVQSRVATNIQEIKLIILL